MTNGIKGFFEVCQKKKTNKKKTKKKKNKPR